MRKSARNSALWLLFVISAVPIFGQDRTIWRSAADIRENGRGTVVGTVLDVDEARRQLQVAIDDDRAGRVTVTTDAISTQYNGFGGMINGQPEIFIGSNGFSNVRLGDRIEVRGTGRTTSSVAAEQVSLLGRSVAAGQTGVGSTRPPGDISTPSATSKVSSSQPQYGRLEGTVRSVDASGTRVVIETDRREIVNILTTSRTPVVYQGRNYEVVNLEQGDRIRVDQESGSSSDRDVRARSIEVIRSVQEGGTGTTPRGVGSVSGRITRIDRATNTVWVTGDRGEVRADLSRANDARGDRVRIADLRVGDVIDLSGSYSGNVYMASTLRMGNDDVYDGNGNGNSDDRNDADRAEFVIVSLSATVVESLQTSPVLLVRERTGAPVTSIYVTEDFVVRAKNGTYTTADRVRAGDQLLVRAYRDADRNLIAQTIRYR